MVRSQLDLFRRALVMLCPLCALLGASACRQNGRRPSAPRVDAAAPRVDGGAVDAGPRADAGSAPDAAEARDAAPMSDAGAVGDAAPVADAGPTASAQIAAVLAAPDGVADLPVDAAWVTYVKPDIGGDGPGFFVQADAMGPALYVHVDPVSLVPPAAVGDEVGFRVTGLATEVGQRRVLSIGGWARASTGHDVTALLQDVSSAVDLVSSLNDYESELLTLVATVTAPFVGAGPGYEAGQIDTAGVMSNVSLKVRMPTSLRAASDLGPGCVLGITGPMWRFNDTAQPSVWADADLSVMSCPAPSLRAAAAVSPTQVRLTFDRRIDPASVDAGGAQLRIVDAAAAPLAVSAAVGSGGGVTLTTSPQVSGRIYTVTANATLTDLLGTGVDASRNTAGFSGYAAPVSRVILNEIDYDQPSTDGAEFIELHNPGTTPVSLATVALVLVNGSSMAEYHRLALGGSIAGGEYIVVAPPAATLSLPGGVRRVDLGRRSIQNGSPDGVALLDTASGVLLDALSYEGAITTATLTGVTGVVSLVEGARATASDSSTVDGSLSRVPDGSDTDDADTDWRFVTTPTPGAANM